MRTITVNSSNGVPAQQVQTIAQTWGELQRDLADKVVSYSGMKAIIGQTQVELLNDNALLGQGNFDLFLFPRKTKSGNQSTENFHEEIKKPSKKSEMASTKKAVVKKVAAKKSVPTKKVAPSKKVVARNTDTKENKTVIKEAPINVTEAIEATEKAMTDIDKSLKAIKLLKDIQSESVKTLLLPVLAQIDDISYVLATGTPRINNLKLRQTAEQLGHSKVVNN